MLPKWPWSVTITCLAVIRETAGGRGLAPTTGEPSAASSCALLGIPAATTEIHRSIRRKFLVRMPCHSHADIWLPRGASNLSFHHSVPKRSIVRQSRTQENLLTQRLCSS